MTMDSSFLLPLFIEMFHELDTLIQNHGDHAQDDDGGYHHVELKETNGVDDKGYTQGNGGALRPASAASAFGSVNF